jgi:hypothetical protein
MPSALEVLGSALRRLLGSVAHDSGTVCVCGDAPVDLRTPIWPVYVISNEVQAQCGFAR